MAVLDWLLLGVIALSVALGAWRGLVFELLSLASWVLAFFVARATAGDVAAWLPWTEWDPSLLHAAAFVLVFVAVVFACGVLAWLGKRLVDAVGLRPADRALGALFGFVRGLLLLLVATLVVLMTPLRDQPWWQSALGGKWLEAGVVAMHPWLPDGVRERLPL